MREGWKTTKLAAVTLKIGSGATPKGGRAAYKDTGISLIRSLNVHDSRFKIKDLARIDEQQAERLANVIVEDGDVLLNITGASIARCCVVPSNILPARVNQHVTIIRPNKEILNSKYLEYLLISEDYRSNLLQVGSSGGSTRQALTKSQLQNFLITFPPTARQKRIVAILDEAFVGIDAAIANTEKNLTNARELFDSYLNSVFSQRGEGWGVKPVGEFAEHCLGKMLDKQKNKGEMKPYLRNVSVQWFQVNADNLLEMPIESHEKERYAVKRGDLLICEGGYPGRAAIWNNDCPIFFQKALHRVRCKDQRFNLWLLYYLYFADATDILKQHFTGAGIQHFTGKALKAFLVPLPPAQLIDGLLDSIKAIQTEVDSLESIYQQKLTALAELKQSLLQKAFTGELTAENMENEAREAMI